MEPLISVRKLRREFRNGDETIVALKDVDLDIHPGEMIAIIGASGSGKSTLMNVLGCLDKSWSGQYTYAGREVSGLSSDELAALRREHFGFIFQRYQLLGDLDARQNVEVPAIYAGIKPEARAERARQLLNRLGLGERMGHRPNEMSGGQQQRVSIARALMNGGEVILADEPTGALDSRSGAELMDLLKTLNREGHTIIIVTHEQVVAENTNRIIEIRDGTIISDRRTGNGGKAAASRLEQPRLRKGLSFMETIDRTAQAFGIALRAMFAHRLRTFLTMLGIIIGIASVVSVVALGQGSQQRVLESIRSIGTNTINIFAGRGFGDRNAGRIETLVPADALALAALPATDSATPRVTSNATGLYRNISASVSINGVGSQYFRVGGLEITQGIVFDEASVQSLGQEAVIDENARTTFFAGEDPLGKVLLLGKLPVRIIGVAKAPTGFGPGNNSTPNVYVPYTTSLSRILGQTFLNAITVRIADNADMDIAESEITRVLTDRHGVQDFNLINTDTIRETIQSATQTMTVFISAIAIVSLLVGGIGVMNIMLVSVTERTREIGIRMAVGARRGDILRQFLIEAILVCITGGAIGVGLSLLGGGIVSALLPTWRLTFSPLTIGAAFASSTLIGIVFGFMPARSAATLDPIEALARD